MVLGVEVVLSGSWIRSGSWSRPCRYQSGSLSVMNIVVILFSRLLLTPSDFLLLPSLDPIDSNGYGELIQVYFGFGVVKVKVFQRVISGPRALQMKLLSGSTSREFVSTSIHVCEGFILF